MAVRLLIAVVALAHFLVVVDHAQAVHARIRFNEYDELVIPRDFRLCDSDAECRPVSELCGFDFRALHRDYVYDAEVALSLEQPHVTCIESYRYRVPAVGCLAGICEVIPDREGCLLRTASGECRRQCRGEMRCQRRAP